MKSLSVESFHAVLFCREWDACVAFYRDILGFEIVDEKRGFVEFRVAPDSRIGLIQSSRKAGLKNEEGSFILSFRVENVEGVQKHFTGKCSEITAVRRHPWGARVFELRDPEGRRLEFWTPE
jgi:catechol 2,3-dioxygenase-like lactoylglutathione lyase family enzyme